MNNVVAMSESNSIINFNKEQVELVKRTVAKGATDDELKMFLYLAKEYNLDPFKKEIWFIKFDKDPVMMTSRDGYLKYAQANPDFEGLMSFAVREGDIFEIDVPNYSVTHKFGSKRGKILGAWAKLEIRGRKPVLCYVDFEEYNSGKNVWRSYPSAMIQKVAESFVLKRGLNINGLMTREEMDSSENPFLSEEPKEVKNQPTKQSRTQHEPKKISTAQKTLMNKLFQEIGYPENIQEDWLHDNFRKKQDELNTAEASVAINKLQDELKEKTIDVSPVEEQKKDETMMGLNDEFGPDDIPF